VSASVKRGRGPYFAQVPWQLQDTPRITAPTIAAYAALQRFADWGGEAGCRASHATLAAKAGLSQAGLRKCLGQLRDLGWIEWTRTGAANAYTVHRSLPGSERDRHDVANGSPPGSERIATSERQPIASTKSHNQPAAPPPRASARGGSTPDSDYGVVMPLVRQHLRPPDGKPPAGWTDGQECTVVRALRHHRTLDELVAAIQGLALLRDYPGQWGDRLNWLAPGEKVTLRALYSPKTATPVPLFNRAAAAYFTWGDRVGPDRAVEEPETIAAVLERMPHA
jgi:hypothetical protein